MALTVEQYRADFLYLYDLVAKVHPKPDFKVPMARLEAERDYALARMAACGSNYDFWQISQRFLNVLGDLQTRILQQYVMDDMVQAPVLTDLVDGKVVVEEVVGAGEEPGIDAVACSLSRGDEILFVDRLEVESPIQERLSVTSYNSTGWGRRQAAQGLLLFPGPEQDGGKSEVTVTAAKADGSIVRVRCPLLPINNPIFARRNMEYHRRSYTHLAEGEFLDGGRIGRLVFRGFQDRHMLENHEHSVGMGLTLDDIPYMDDILWGFFREAEERGTRKLIIDLRRAQGGSPQCMDMPLKFLTDKPLAQHRSWARVTKTLRDSWCFFAGMEDGIHDVSFEGYTGEFPYYTTLPKECLESVRPFKGDVFVVIDDNIYGGSWLAARMSANDIGTFVGEPARVAAEPGSIVGHQLPNTGFWLGMSCMFFEPPAPEHWSVEAILPHHYVRQTLEDYRQGRDTIMEEAFRLCRQG